MREKLHYMNELFEKNPNYMNLSDTQKILVKLNFIVSRLIKRTALIDYVQYNYFLLNRLGQCRFINVRRRNIIAKKLNNKEGMVIFDNKAQFYQHFSQYINREWLDLKTASRGEVEKFIDSRDEIILKPGAGYFGIGVEKIKSADIKSIEDFYQKYGKHDFIIEESIKQHEEFAAFNESSFNTCRIVTITENDKVDIFGAVLRMGREGCIVDNFHSGGLFAAIDVETGIVKTPATDHEFSSYIMHPDSKKLIIGYKVPYWENIISTAKEASLVHAEVGYVGWDIGINAEGETVVLEGNSRPEPDVLQRADQNGKWPQVLQYL